MKRRIIIGVVCLVLPAVVLVAVAIATPPSGLMGFPITRGAAGEFRIDDKSAKLKFVAKQSTDIPLVRATLTPGGFTGWHGHAGPSLVIVSSGELTMLTPARRGDDDDEDDDDEDEGRGGTTCNAELFRAGQAFVHPEGPHNFVAGAAGAEFYIVYFLPAGASPAPIDVTPAPAGCA